jgi:hypothetical protein
LLLVDQGGHTARRLQQVWSFCPQLMHPASFVQAIDY